MKDEKVYIKRLLEIIKDLETYIGDDNFENFSKNQMQIDASIMKLQVLWESIKKIWKYDGIPYKDIIWFRDWISHDYFWLDLEIIWETLKQDIPDLKVKLLKIYNNNQI